MTATARPVPARRPDARSPRGLGALVRSEARLFLRDPGTVFFALVFPTVLALGIGYGLPGMREPITDASMGEAYQGLTPMAVLAPVVLATAIASPALITLPSVVAGYRERGVLRRLATTPMRPQGILVAQVVVNVVAFVAAAAIALGLMAALFGLVAPERPIVVAAGFVLGALAMFGVGLLIAALVGKSSTAGGIGTLVYFPMLFFAGLWTPGPLMPDAVAAVARFTPLGAASQAMTEGWYGTDVPWLQLVVMAAYVLVLYPLSARLFRWS